jgi:hypothetical protein
MRLAALQSVVNAGPAGLSGCLRPRRRGDFSSVPVVPPPASSPAPSRDRVHPLLSSASSSECEPFRTCPSHGCEERLPWGSLPHRGINKRDPLASEDPSLALRSAPGVSHALDGLRPLLPCGLVSSHNHVRDSPLRGSFPPPSWTVSSTTHALLPLPTVPCRRVASTAPAPVTSPSGLRSGRRSAVTDGGFSPADTRSPHRLVLPRVHLRAPGKDLHPSSAHDLVASSCV